MEITAQHGAGFRPGSPPAATLEEAITAAFTAIGRLHDLLSVHDANSELSRLNREADRHPVTVSASTYEILRRADRLAVESNGAFDYTVAPTLARWGLLPEHLNRTSPGNWRDVSFLRRRQIRFLRPLALDLGGIAKGFAVDTAVDVLRAHGIAAAVVNAGGDLRVFGPQPSVIQLRHPAQPQALAGHLDLCNAALATSSPCFTEFPWRDRRVSHLVNSNTGAAITGHVSVSVRAPECWLADALTKVVLNAPQRAEKLLAKYRAEAFMLTA